MATDVQGSQVHTVIAVSIIFAVLTFFVLSLRLFARYYVLRTIGLVDCKSSNDEILEFILMKPYRVDDCSLRMISSNAGVRLQD